MTTTFQSVDNLLNFAVRTTANYHSEEAIVSRQQLAREKADLAAQEAKERAEKKKLAQIAFQREEIFRQITLASTKGEKQITIKGNTYETITDWSNIFWGSTCKTPGFRVHEEVLAEFRPKFDVSIETKEWEIGCMCSPDELYDGDCWCPVETFYLTTIKWPKSSESSEPPLTRKEIKAVISNSDQVDSSCQQLKTRRPNPRRRRRKTNRH